MLCVYGEHALSAQVADDLVQWRTEHKTESKWRIHESIFRKVRFKKKKSLVMY